MNKRRLLVRVLAAAMLACPFLLSAAEWAGGSASAAAKKQKAQATRLVEHEVLPLFESGDLRVPVAATFPLDEVEDAYARFEAGGKLGKIVLLP